MYYGVECRIYIDFQDRPLDSKLFEDKSVSAPFSFM